MYPSVQRIRHKSCVRRTTESSQLWWWALKGSQASCRHILYSTPSFACTSQKQVIQVQQALSSRWRNKLNQGSFIYPTFIASLVQAIHRFKNVMAPQQARKAVLPIDLFFFWADFPRKLQNIKISKSPTCPHKDIIWPMSRMYQPFVIKLSRTCRG